MIYDISDRMTYADVPLSARNILEDGELKNAVKNFR